MDKLLREIDGLTARFLPKNKAAEADFKSKEQKHADAAKDAEDVHSASHPIASNHVDPAWSSEHQNAANAMVKAGTLSMKEFEAAKTDARTTTAGGAFDGKDVGSQSEINAAKAKVEAEVNHRRGRPPGTKNKDTSLNHA